MNNQYLIVYKFNVLFQILEELDLDLNFKIIQETNETSIKQKIKNLNNYLIFLNLQIFEDVHYFDSIIDLFFFFDIILGFRVTYRDPHTNEEIFI